MEKICGCCEKELPAGFSEIRMIHYGIQKPYAKPVVGLISSYGLFCNDCLEILENMIRDFLDGRRPAQVAPVSSNRLLDDALEKVRAEHLQQNLEKAISENDKNRQQDIVREALKDEKERLTKGTSKPLYDNGPWVPK